MDAAFAVFMVFAGVLGSALGFWYANERAEHEGVCFIITLTAGAWAAASLIIAALAFF